MALEAWIRLDSLSKQKRTSVPDLLRASSKHVQLAVGPPARSRARAKLRLALPMSGGGDTVAQEAAVTEALEAVLLNITQAACPVDTRSVPSTTAAAVATTHEQGMAQACELLRSVRGRAPSQMEAGAAGDSMADHSNDDGSEDEFDEFSHRLGAVSVVERGGARA